MNHLFDKVLNFFNPPSEKAKELLAQNRLLISRLNEESGIPNATTTSMLNKYYSSFDEELYATFAALLGLAKRVSEHKEHFNTFPDWFETKMLLTSESTFEIFNHISSYHSESLEKYIIDFYKEKPANNSIVYDYRDKMRSNVLID